MDTKVFRLNTGEIIIGKSTGPTNQGGVSRVIDAFSFEVRQMAPNQPPQGGLVPWPPFQKEEKDRVTLIPVESLTVMPYDPTDNIKDAYEQVTSNLLLPPKKSLILTAG